MGYPLFGEPMFSIAALSHFEVAVSSIVIARAAFLILPRHRAIRVAEPIANIAVCAVTAWDRPPAAAILQGIIPIETAEAPFRSGSTCRLAHRDRSRGRTAANGR